MPLSSIFLASPAAAAQLLCYGADHSEIALL